MAPEEKRKTAGDGPDLPGYTQIRTHRPKETRPAGTGWGGCSGSSNSPFTGRGARPRYFPSPIIFSPSFIFTPPKDAPKGTQTPPRVSDMRMRVQAHFQISSLAHPARRCHLYSELAPQPRNPPASTHTTEIRARQLNLSPPCRGTGWRGGCGTGAPHLGLGKEKKREKEETERRQRG